MNTDVYAKTRIVICLCGNDGTGKSSMAEFINQYQPDVVAVQRSMKKAPQFLLNQIKLLDQLTFNYSFDPQRYQFQPCHQLEDNERQVPIYWVMLDATPKVIAQRLSTRIKVNIYDSPKCVQYFAEIYRQLAYFYGIPLISTQGRTFKQIYSEILKYCRQPIYEGIRSLAMKNLTIQKIWSLNLENSISQKVLLHPQSKQILKQAEIAIRIDWKNTQLDQVYGTEEWDNQLALKLCSRYLLQQFKQTKLTQIEIAQKRIKLQLPALCVVPYIEGESKQLYKIYSPDPTLNEYFSSFVLIILKSTVYSHTKQTTCQIEQLAKVRAVGSMISLQLLRRNQISHAYQCINLKAIIFSKEMQTNQIECVFKRQCLGTDKHSYQGMLSNPKVVCNQIANKINGISNQTGKGQYSTGVYVRFDWRNPNHVINNCLTTINKDPYYYLIERHLGKENFFEKKLKSNQNVQAKGDKCITSDLISGLIDVPKHKLGVLKFYCTLSAYAQQIGLEIVDGCLMFDREGQVIWSEVNPDCMRVKRKEGREDLDKDIWRYGGSSKKELLLQKWKTFNHIFIGYLRTHKFLEHQLLQFPQSWFMYQKIAQSFLSSTILSISKEYQHYYRQLLSSGKNSMNTRQFIVTIDISDNKPVLVKNSQIIEEERDARSLEQAYQYLQLCPQIALIDLDAALGKKRKNQDAIKSMLARNRNCALVGGGIRSLEKMKEWMSLAKKIIISTNLSFLKQLSLETLANKVIVELSINSDNQILTHGRTVNTGVNVIEKMRELAILGIKNVSITFCNSQGRLQGLPRQQLLLLMPQIPSPIKQVIIAGGISSMEDIEFIWQFRKAIPQLGSAIWKKKINISDIFSKIGKLDSQGLLPAVIVDEEQRLLGNVFMNPQALKLTCQTKMLHRFSRKNNRIMKKGEESGNTQEVLQIMPDCDNDCLKIMVKSVKPFCHLNSQTCFKDNYEMGLLSLQKHIREKKVSGSGYSRKMQENQGLAASKVYEQMHELFRSSTRKTDECADLLAHLIMYMNSVGIETSTVMKKLTDRAQKEPKKRQQPNISKKYLVLVSGKHSKKIDAITSQLIGIDVLRASNRSLQVKAKVVDPLLRDKMLPQKFDLLATKPKDAPQMLAQNFGIIGTVNYSIIMENSFKTWSCQCKVPLENLSLVMLSKSEKQIEDPKNWTPESRKIIASEYPFSVAKYLANLHISEDCFKLVKVSGSTQSYLFSDHFDYCDAIMESGETIKDNGLSIVAVLQKVIYAGFYVPI